VPTPRRSQADRSRATRTALVQTARTLFAERGYAAVSTEEIVRAAGVTRGALYHHFADKRELFQAVLEQLEAELTADLDTAAADAPDPLTGGLAALGRFLQHCQQPEVIQISLTDAPAALGWQTWRDIQSRYGLRLIIRMLEGAAADGALAPAPIPTLAQLVLSACIEAALTIAHADDREAAKTNAEQALTALLSGLITS
jgi:AcrR family transcriptional regulator